MGTDELTAIENVIGSAYDDEIKGDGGANAFIGGDGDDRLNGRGGVGDIASYITAEAGVRVNLELQGSAQDTLGAGNDTLLNIEFLTGSSFDDTLTGDASGNLIKGLIGNDSLIGNDGDDDLRGGVGNDFIFGGTGNNTLRGGKDNDTFFASSGGIDTFIGGSGYDTLSYTGDTADVVADLVAGTIVGTEAETISSIEALTLGAGNNAVIVGAVDGDIHSFDGGAGDNTLDYSASSDGFVWDDAAGTINSVMSYVNFQTFVLTNYDDVFTAGVEAVVVNAGEGIDLVEGSDQADDLQGGKDADELFGNAGDDTLDGGRGDDEIYGGDNADFLEGGNGVDLLDGGKGVDVLNGENGNDEIYGGGGKDTINGGDGDDDLYGNNKGDIFVFDEGFGTDTIHDFDISEADEVVDLSAIAAIVDFTDLLSQDGADTVIDDLAGNTIRLVGIAFGDLTDLEFVF